MNRSPLHFAALANIEEYDRRKGIETLKLGQYKTVYPDYKSKRGSDKYKEVHKKPMNDMKSDQVSDHVTTQVTTHGRLIQIAGQGYDRGLCHRVYRDYKRGNADQAALAQQYTLPKMVIHSIIRKGEWNKL